MVSKCAIALAAILCAATVHGKWSCKVTADCVGLDDALCHEGECVCARAGMQINEEKSACVDAAPYLNSSCQDAFQCQHLITGFTCHDNNGTKTCACRDDHRYLHGRCWRAARFGEPCLASQQCEDPLMPLALQCLAGQCACRQDHYSRERGLCRRIASELDDFCILDQDCQIPSVPGAVCDVALLRCKNPAVQSGADETENRRSGLEMVESVSVNMALQMSPASEGQECSADEECAALGAARCSHRRCVCEAGYPPSADKTACIAELGLPVADAKYCTGFGAKVVNGICDCPAGFFYQDSWNCKKPSRRFGDSCNDDISCYTFGSSGRCAASGDQGLRTCHCDPATSLKDEERQICQLFDRTIGDACTSSEQCPNNVECIEELCSCKDDQPPDELGTSCIIVGLDLGEECKLDIQCKTDNSKCVDTRCSCQDNYFQTENVCLLGLGGVCAIDDDCMVGNSTCSSDVSRCECAAGFVPSDSQLCFQVVADASRACEIDAQCWPTVGDNSTVTCVSGLCECREDSHFRDGGCWKKTVLREVCARTPQCYTSRNPARTECRNSQCQCAIGFIEEYEPDRCSGASPLATMTTNLRTFLILVLAMIFLCLN